MVCNWGKNTAFEENPTFRTFLAGLFSTSTGALELSHSSLKQDGVCLTALCIAHILLANTLLINHFSSKLVLNIQRSLSWSAWVKQGSENRWRMMPPAGSHSNFWTISTMLNPSEHKVQDQQERTYAYANYTFVGSVQRLRWTHKGQCGRTSRYSPCVIKTQIQHDLSQHVGRHSSNMLCLCGICAVECLLQH